MAEICLTLPFDSMQTSMYVAVNNHPGLSIADTGAYKTAMDLHMVQAFGLCMQLAVNGE